MVYIGIDIAKLKHFASVVSSDGEVIVKPFPFENSRQGFIKLIEEITSNDINKLYLSCDEEDSLYEDIINNLTKEDNEDINEWILNNISINENYDIENSNLTEKSKLIIKTLFERYSCDCIVCNAGKCRYLGRNGRFCKSPRRLFA